MRLSLLPAPINFARKREITGTSIVSSGRHPNSGSRWTLKMLFLASTSLGLFLRAITHSVQNRPLNHSANVGTSSFFVFFSRGSSFSGRIAGLASAATTALIARCSASSAPTLVAARSQYGPGAPGVP